MRGAGPARHIVLALALAACAACGWRTSLPTPIDGESVGIEIFDVEREILERGLAPLLHDQMTLAATNLIALRLVAPGRADLVVRGKILEYRRRGGIRSSDFDLLETAIRVGVEAQLIDRKSGEPVGEPVRTHVWSGYGLDQPTNEDEARERALHYLAETLILDLFGRKAASTTNATSDDE